MSSDWGMRGRDEKVFHGAVEPPMPEIDSWMGLYIIVMYWNAHNRAGRKLILLLWGHFS